MSITAAGGAALAQRRNLVTAIPGPASQEKLARKKQYVADGVARHSRSSSRRPAAESCSTPTATR